MHYQDATNLEDKQGEWDAGGVQGLATTFVISTVLLNGKFYQNELVALGP